MFFETQNLCFAYYKSAMTLKDISFSAEKFSKTMVLSSKNMGKTTFLKVLSGFENSRFGNIYLNGKELKQISDKDKKFSLVLAEPVLIEKKSIKENLDFQCEMSGKEKLSNEKTNEILNKFYICKDQSVKVKKLSLFEKRKFQMVRAILKEPQILFLDDQFENLNDDEVLQMFEIYEKLLNYENLTIIFAVGDRSFKRFGEKFSKLKCDKVLYLNLAKVTEFKNDQEFKNSYISLDAFKFLENIQTENCYIEKEKSEYWLCVGDERLFKFDSKFCNKLDELKLEFGDIEECVVLNLNRIMLNKIDSNEFNKGLKLKSIFIYSRLTGNLII